MKAIVYSAGALAACLPREVTRFGSECIACVEDGVTLPYNCQIAFSPYT